MKKIMSVFMTIMLVVACFSTVFATATAMPTPTDPGLDSGMVSFVGIILGAIRWIGYAIAIGMLIYVGIKYVMASANEKADLKNAMIKYVIGAILIAGAASIAGWIFDIGGKAQ